MAKKKKEAVVEAVEQPIVDDTVEKIKIKKPKIKKFDDPNEVFKVDLNELKEKAEEVIEVEKTEEITENSIEKPEEVTEVVLEEVSEIKEPTLPKQPDLPESLQKVVEFMKDTGGDLKDYINLNQDYNEWDNDSLLREYYQSTKPHLNQEEISFLIEDNFNYNENIDDERDVKRKKLALKEQVASAKDHLDGMRSKYYEDLKMGSKLTEEQKNAVEFFNNHNEQSAKTEEATNLFLQKTNEVFNDDFKGFEYKVGDKRYRFNVKDTDKTRENQSDINNFVKKFLNEENQIEDARGYHKSLFTAMNSDAIANHFYEQGKADALKESIAKSKNVNMDPRQQHEATDVGGLKFKVLNDSKDFSFKIKKNK
jgi:hypothetical protein